MARLVFASEDAEQIRGAVTAQEAGADLALTKKMPALSGPNLFAGLLFSSIGFVGFIYGKRMSAWKPMFLGIALMAYPYFIEDTLTICAIGLAGLRRAFLVAELRRFNPRCFRGGLAAAAEYSAADVR